MSSRDQPGARAAGPRYACSLGRHDVGHRVVVRRQLADGRLGDLLGELLQWDDEAVCVLDRHGVRHEVSRSDVVAGKRVPPAPARRG